MASEGLVEATQEEAEALEMCGVDIYVKLDFPSGAGFMCRGTKNIAYSSDMFDGDPTITYYIRSKGEEDE